MRKLIIISLSCAMALLVLGYTGYRGYQIWKEKHWLSMAKDFAVKADGRNQLLCLQQVLRTNPKNFEACSMMADLTEAARSPSALIWRQRVVESNPKQIENRLALARTALLFQNYAIATAALDGLEPSARKTADYHNLAGTVAMAMGQPTVAESHFSEAARSEPWNLIPQLNLAVVHLHSTNMINLTEARTSLQKISVSATNLHLRNQALRELVLDAIRFNQTARALEFSSELLKQTNSAFRDRLLRLAVLHDTKSAQFSSTLATFQNEAAENDGKIFELATWQMANLDIRKTLAWLQSLPQQKQTNQNVAVVMAEAHAQLEEWPTLQATLKSQNWDDLEFLRLAFMTKALRSQNLDAAAKAEWIQSRNAAVTQKARLQMLVQFAAHWKWQSETEELLWLMVNHFPDEQASFRMLARVLYENGRTRPLLSLYQLQAKRKPDDLILKNDLAMAALLLGAPELKPHDLSREVYFKAPTNISFASTYAFALYLQGKSEDALKIFRKFKPEELENPAIAGYYGLVLNATGQKDKAQIYFNWALKSKLLPEERQLFEMTRPKSSQSEPDPTNFNMCTFISGKMLIADYVTALVVCAEFQTCDAIRSKKTSSLIGPELDITSLNS